MHPFKKRGRIQVQSFKKRVSAIRRRTKHTAHTSRKRESFGINKLRSLFWIPVLVAAIVLVVWIKTPVHTLARFRPTEPTVARPLCGWAVDATTDPDEVEIPNTLVFATLTWRELETAEGEYDFSSFEERVHMAKWREKGVRFVLRFVCDVPSGTRHADIPDYLIERLGDSAGEYYDSPTYGKGFAPNYADLQLQERHHAAIAALGQRYGQDDAVAFVELGSLGHNGQWLVDLDAGVSPLPLPSDAKTYIWHYAEAFPNAKLLTRLPYRQARLLGAGVYNPFLGDSERTWEWLDMLEYGGYDEQLSVDVRALTTQAIRGASLADASSLTKDPDALFLQADSCQLTYISGISGANMTPGEKEAADRLDGLMGYRYWIRSAEWPEKLRAGYRLRVDVKWVNSGVAPIGEAWPVELSLLNEDGSAILSQNADIDLTQVAEGSHALSLYMDVPNDMPAGTYRLGVAVNDPATGQPAVELCMDSEKSGLRAVLGELEIVR